MIHSFDPAATLAQYRIVYVSAENTVNYVNTITSMPIGVTKDTVKDTNGGIPVATAGERAYVAFNDSVAAGALYLGYDSLVLKHQHPLPVTDGLVLVMHNDNTLAALLHDKLLDDVTS